MTKTYSEQRALILFRASRELRKVAAQVLDDVQNPVELASFETLRWAKDLSARIARRANELENEGHEQGIATTRWENDLYKSKALHSDAVTRFQQRIDSVDPELRLKVDAS